MPGTGGSVQPPALVTAGRPENEALAARQDAAGTGRPDCALLARPQDGLGAQNLTRRREGDGPAGQVAERYRP